MLKIAILSLAVAAVGLAAAALWQHLRYLEIRRERVDDRQPLLHRGSAFHGVVLLKVADGAGREGEDTPGCHHPDFDFDDELIPVGLEMFLGLVRDRFPT